MKIKLSITPIILALSLFLFSCDIAEKQVSIEISCDDFYENHHITNEVQVSEGETITLTLCSNPSTGFQWEPTVLCPLRAVILAELEHKYIPPEENDGIPIESGEPGREVWIFKAVSKGTAGVSFDYRRPGESIKRGEWIYSLTVNVK